VGAWTYSSARCTRLSLQTLLLHPCTTTLNQNDQHDDKEHAGYDPDNRGTVHVVESPFLCLLEKLAERVRHSNDGGTKHNYKERWEDKEDERKDQLDRQLGRLLFNLLDALGPERFGMNT